MLIFILVFIIFLTSLTKIKPMTNSNLQDLINKFNGIDTLESKVDCLTATGYCFVTSDCAGTVCSNQTTFACVNGVCKSQVVETENIKNECDPSKGLFGYLVGDVAFGRYTYVCKSLDPGIVNVDGTNLMCKGGQIEINYVNRLPTKDDCTCPESKIIIPATNEKREHVECVKSSDLWLYS